MTEITIAIKADYIVKNIGCNCIGRRDWDVFFNHEDDPLFNYCPFCGGVLRRQIIPKNTDLWMTPEEIHNGFTAGKKLLWDKEHNPHLNITEREITLKKLAE